VSGLLLGNLVSYSAQLAALVGAAALAAWALRIRSPRPALLFWNSVLVSSVLLPLAFSGRSHQGGSVLALARIVDFAPAAPPMSLEWSRVAAVLLVAIAGIAVIRLGWIALGLIRLRVIRRRSQPLLPLPSFVVDLSSRLQTSAAIHVSDDVACPVTLGFRMPLVLLPKCALDQPLAVQRAIVCHELLHVRRHDWLRTLLEQVWSSLLWFHPAAHVLRSRIGLMREAVVDEETIRITGDRRAYAQALLAFADPAPLTPLPVMHLIKPRHLPRRIALIAQEVHMSRRHSITALAAALLLVTLATGATARRLPIELSSALAAPPSSTPTVQEALKPGDGVTLPRVIKEVRPQYTAAAMHEKIQGSVHIEMVVSTSGEPTELRVTQSLDAEYGLDEAALRAAADWRFEPGRKDGKPVPVLITLELTFKLK
jgi:TonB family protein